MKLIAHRGISAHYHENTLPAFKHALNIGVVAIEVDLHQIDDEFFIFHDFELDRLLNMSGELKDLSLQSVKEARLKGGCSIPTLQELFELTQGKCALNLELKKIANPTLLIEHITRYLSKYESDIIISSFDHHLLVQFQKALRDTRINKFVKIGALIGHLPIDYAQYAVSLGADVAGIDAHLVTPEFVKHAHSFNIEVWCYTVNTPDLCSKLKDMQVDAIFTNDPELLTTTAAN